MVSPDEINAKSGITLWRCFGCKVASGLHWWNGLSVAVCSKQECSQAYVQLLQDQYAAEQSLAEHIREHYGE